MDKPKKVVHSDGTIEYHLKNGKTHREDGPARIYTDGSEWWCIEGYLHREDGPAVIDKNGYKAWYLKGSHHRLDGPAVVNKNGSEEWWINNIKLTVDEADLAKQILSGSYPLKQLPLLINHPALKYFALRGLGGVF